MRRKDFLFFMLLSGIFLLLGLFLYQTQQFALFYREQQQLFLFDSDYIIKFFQQPGGVSILTARFLVQFFHLPIFAVILTTFVLYLTAVMICMVFRRMHMDISLLPLCVIPSLCLAISLLDNNFHYEGITSYLLMVMLLLSYCCIPKRNILLRTVSGIFFTLVCFYLAGAISLLFSICAFLYDLLLREKKSFFSLSYILSALILGFVFVQMGTFPIYEHIYTPIFYYEITAKCPFIHYVSWLSLPISLFIGFFIHKIFIKRQLFIRILLGGLIFIFIFISFNSSYKSRIPHNLNKFYQYEYLSVNERWDELKKTCSKSIRDYNDANYLSLALAQKEELISKLFHTPQFGPQSLIFISENKTIDVRLARILFSMGNMAAAQNIAFNSVMVSNGYNPSMLKMLLQIDLMRGSYLTALKYIELLERSLHYDTWASEQRKFLFNDTLVEQDPILGMGRKSFPTEESFVLYTSPMDDLYKILDTNPANKMAMEYALSYLLLAKDINHVRDFIDRYYGTPALKSLPVPAQEALIFYCDYYQSIDEAYAIQNGLNKKDLLFHKSADWEYCKKHGVSKETFKRFSVFKDAYGKIRQNQPVALSKHEKTFWYYLLFTQI